MKSIFFILCALLWNVGQAQLTHAKLYGFYKVTSVNYSENDIQVGDVMKLTVGGKSASNLELFALGEVPMGGKNLYWKPVDSFHRINGGKQITSDAYGYTVEETTLDSQGRVLNNTYINKNKMMTNIHGHAVTIPIHYIRDFSVHTLSLKPNNTATYYSYVKNQFVRQDLGLEKISEPKARQIIKQLKAKLKH